MLASPLTRGCLIAIVATGGALAGCGMEQSSLQVRVIDSLTSSPIGGAAVRIDGYRQVTTDAVGVARFTVRSGVHDLEVSARNYDNFAGPLSVLAGSTNLSTVRMNRAAQPQPGASPTPAPGPTPSPGASVPPGPKPSPSAPAEQTVTLFGRVTDPTGARVPNATIFVASEMDIPFGQPATTNAVGEYKLVAKVPVKGTTVRVAAMADNYQTRIRYVAPSGTWRFDFTGAYALQPVTTEPELPPFDTVEGRVEDTMGRPVAWGIVKVESDNVRYPFRQFTLVKDGHYDLSVPTRLPLRFTASAANHRSVTFTQEVKATSDRVQDFVGYRALDPTPILEGE